MSRKVMVTIAGAIISTCLFAHCAFPQSEQPKKPPKKVWTTDDLVEPTVTSASPLSQPPLVAHEHYERLGLHSCDRFWRRGAPQTVSSDVVFRIRSCIPLAGLQYLDDVQEEAISYSAADWVSVDGPATRFRRMSLTALGLYGKTGFRSSSVVVNLNNKLKQS
jgi:hypothetical protein